MSDDFAIEPVGAIAPSQALDNHDFSDKATERLKRVASSSDIADRLGALGDAVGKLPSSDHFSFPAGTSLAEQWQEVRKKFIDVTLQISGTVVSQFKKEIQRDDKAVEQGG